MAKVPISTIVVQAKTLLNEPYLQAPLIKTSHAQHSITDSLFEDD